jgi:hypothetical protein
MRRRRRHTTLRAASRNDAPASTRNTNARRPAGPSFALPCTFIRASPAVSWQTTAGEARMNPYPFTTSVGTSPSTRRTRRLGALPPASTQVVRRLFGRKSVSGNAHAGRDRRSGGGGGYTGYPSEFRRLILPTLIDIRAADLARATGLSPGYCAQTRDGRRMPHIRHWATLQLAGLSADPAGTGGRTVRSSRDLSGCHARPGR